MVSAFSNHFINWVSQLEDSSYEIYWFDLHDNHTYVKRLDFVHQIVKWKRKYDFKGRYWFKFNLPYLYRIIEKFNNRNFVREFEKQLNQINPDVVQSFELHSACAPILDIMVKNPGIKWIYSSMGSDIYYFQKFPKKLEQIKKVFKRIDYMFSDNKREHILARKYGFKGEFLGVFPGGGGYDLGFCKSLIRSNERDLIIIKGYQSQFGRCIPVLQALEMVKDEIPGIKFVVFGCKSEVEKYIERTKLDQIIDLEVKGKIGRVEVLKLMGRSWIYIGNSLSDGIPNTLLEAIIMGAFPIQSNPGKVTEEVIKDNENGYLIKNPEDIGEIAGLLKKAIYSREFVNKAVVNNNRYLRPKLDRKIIQEQVLTQYDNVEKSLALKK